MPLRSRLLGRLCAGALLCALVACGDRSRPREHIVIVLVDQLRYDSAAQWMPRTNALAERGIVLDQMRAAAPWTYPSVLSLMTGLWPQQHGADGSLYENRLTTFSRDLPVLPKLLRADGYHTAGFVTNPFLHDFNPFHEGFEHYDIHFINSQGNLRGLGEHVWTSSMFADSVNPAVREYWSRRPVDGPEFTYVHYIDVHGPWEGAPFAPDYEAAVRYVDERIAELYDFFHQRYDGRMLFFVTSDHGQDLGDDLGVGDGAAVRVKKKSLHDFNLRIPFYVLPGALVPEPRHVSVPCSNVDFVPTLFDWLDVDPPDSLAGRSLLPAMRGEPPGLGERALYAKNSAFAYLGDCMVLEGKKYMRVYDPRSRAVVLRRVYDLAADPREVRAVSDVFGAAGQRLVEVADTGGVAYPAELEETDAELLRQLQGIGYLGGDAASEER